MTEETKENKKQKQEVNFLSGIKGKLVVLIVLLAAAGGIGWYMSSDQTEKVENLDPNEPVAVVNGEEISRADMDSAEREVATSQGMDITSLDDQTIEQIRTNALNALIAQILLNQAVENSDINVPQEDIDSQIDEIKSQYDSEEVYAEELVNQGVTEEQLRELIAEELKMRMFVEQESGSDSLSATNEEVEDFYEDSVAQGEDGPALEEIRPQIEQMIVQQKQQEQLAAIIQQLRANAEIEILI